MPKLAIPLTATQVKAARPKECEYTLSDSEGLALRIRPSGSRTWLFSYRQLVTKKRKNIAFGSYPEITLASARKLRFDARTLLASGVDPKEYRDEQQATKLIDASNTLKQVTKEWIKIKRSQVSSDHADDIYRSLEKDIFPRLGNVAINDITARGTIDVIKPIAARGNHETVKRLCQRLNEVAVFAVNTGLLQHNSLAGIKSAFQTPVKNHLPTLKPEELPELMKTLSRASLKYNTRCLIEFLLHTMVRPGEAAGALWEEIDLENALWRIPASRMKGQREHSVPLTAQVLAILEEMKEISGHRVHVFSGDRNPKQHMNPYTANMALKRMGLSGRLCAHGLRSLASTTLNEHAFDYALIESALSHSIGSEVSQAYNRAEHVERRRVMMAWWSNHINDATLTSMISKPSNIVNIKEG